MKLSLGCYFSYVYSQKLVRFEVGHASSRTIVYLVFILFWKYFSPWGEFIIIITISWVTTLRPDVMDMRPRVELVFSSSWSRTFSSFSGSQRIIPRAGKQKTDRARLGGHHDDYGWTSYSGHHKCSLVASVVCTSIEQCKMTGRVLPSLEVYIDRLPEQTYCCIVEQRFFFSIVASLLSIGYSPSRSAFFAIVWVYPGAYVKIQLSCTHWAIQMHH